METQAAGVDLSVVIVSYNVRHFLEQALGSVRRASPHLHTEVFVVDNCSADDSVAMVRQKFPEVRLVANLENIGFARANNQAIRQASGRYILLLNPDTVVEEDTFDKCFAFMEAHPEAGALGVHMIDGTGHFLPESRRGFPSPFVAFCKTFGLSALFPRSKRFNRYYMGYLDPALTHEADVLSGAFMWIRQEAIARSGLLDEAFFMYGEDIDLSYRLVLAGYKNFYFPETTIIHYKGESTKKGSLNYVKTFYQAMIIFARKHFEGRTARWFVWMLQCAIYFRAGLTLLRQAAQRLAWPLADATLLYTGLVLLKHFWAVYRFSDPNYYAPSFLYFNAPLYTLLWLSGIYLSGGYDSGARLLRVLRGLLLGTLFIAVIYGFLDQALRTSRAIILLGTAWSLSVLFLTRVGWHLLRHGELLLSSSRPKNLLIIGSANEVGRVRELLRTAPTEFNYTGAVRTTQTDLGNTWLGHIGQLREIVRLYRAEVLIFCARDLPASQIMHWMSVLGSEIAYKIALEESQTIIGSHSKNNPGELFTIDIRYRVDRLEMRRNKRLFDVLICALLLLTSPVILFIQWHPQRFLRNWIQVLAGKKSWVGYAPDPESYIDLPRLKPGVLSPALRIPDSLRDRDSVRRLNLLYARDYQPEEDLRLLLSHLRYLG